MTIERNSFDLIVVYDSKVLLVWALVRKEDYLV